jgi:spore maturation protein CgeB
MIMRIFFASDHTPNSAFTSSIWRSNLYLPLLDLGHEVIEFKYDLRDTFLNLNPQDPRQATFIRRNRPKVTEELLHQIRQAHSEKPFDLFFSYFYDACVLPEAIDEIRNMGIKTINWFCNGSYQLHLVSEISPHYDWCLVPERFRLRDYINLGARPIYCQEAANPNIYKPHNLPQDYNVTFVGQAYGDRPKFIKSILEQGIDVRVWGHGWKNYSFQQQVEKRSIDFSKRLQSLIQKNIKLANPKQLIKNIIKRIQTNNKTQNLIQLPNEVIGGVLSDNELIKMYSRSKINLGFSTCGNTHATNQRIVQLRLRDFEVPMSGGFYMVEYMEELEEFFEVGKEIVCYTSIEDLIDKIQYYLKNDSEREAIRLRGHERCLRDHSWHRRFKSVFEQIALDGI